MLAGEGGALGLLLAWWGKDVLVALSPESVARIGETRLDGRVFIFTALILLGTGVLFGIAPALAAAGVNLSEALKEGGRSTGVRLSGARSLLVIFEIALALVLLVGGGLLLQSLLRLQRTGLGFNTANV